MKWACAMKSKSVVQKSVHFFQIDEANSMLGVRATNFFTLGDIAICNHGIAVGKQLDVDIGDARVIEERQNGTKA